MFDSEDIVDFSAGARRGSFTGLESRVDKNDFEELFTDDNIVAFSIWLINWIENKSCKLFKIKEQILVCCG